MAFLRVNGVPIDAMIDTIDIKDASVEKYDRTAMDGLEGLTYSVKREISFTTTILTQQDAFAMEGWLRGRGHFWSFQRPDVGTTRFTLNSADAALALSLGTTCFTPCFGSYGLLLHNGFSSNVTTGFGSEGDWSIHFYHRVESAASFASYGVVSRNGTISAWQAGASAATIKMLSISAASGMLGISLQGRNVAGGAVTSQYANLSVMRYAMTSEMFMALPSVYFGTPTTNWSRTPYVCVTGDCLAVNTKTCNEALEPGPMYAKAFVESISIRPAMMQGGLKYAARQLKVRLVEK